MDFKEWAIIIMVKDRCDIRMFGGFKSYEFAETAMRAMNAIGNFYNESRIIRLK